MRVHQAAMPLGLSAAGGFATTSKMKTIHLVLPVLLCAVLGCVEGRTPREKFHSRMRADPAPLSAFLPDHRLLKKQPNTFPFHYFYLKDNAKRYNRVYIAPVDISQLRQSSDWADFDKAMSGELGTKMDDLTAYMQKAYRRAFQKKAAVSKLQVIDAPSREPGTLVVETAIISYCPTKAELIAVGAASSFLVPVIGTVVANMIGSGSITIECRLRDASTGELVSMYATTESDPQALINIAQFTWATSARINIKQVAAYTAQVYLAAHDYRKVNRKFPVSWTSLIKDADLDEGGK